ncbi:MAG TPA: phosphopyruvate hydratase [Bryobacteraceae bacterium]|nr:phosphopyruvate hydratase [Bryobacteraceae bacterium]
MTLTLSTLHAMEILDSRGKPTIAVQATLSDGESAWAQVPSGASTGRHEARELRDSDPARYHGAGVQRAVANVQRILGPGLAGMLAGDHPALDARMIELDGSSDKSRLGANAILGVSCAVARAVSQSRKLPLWKYLHETFPGNRAPSIPSPMVNILSGGLHAGQNIEFQDFLVTANGIGNYADALQAIVAVHRAARQVLADRSIPVTGVADEGGWGPLLPSNEAALQILTEAIERAGFQPREQMSIAIDAAATHFYSDGSYRLESESRTLSSGSLIGLLEEWSGKYPIYSIEDGLAEDDWAGWQALTRRLGDRLQLVGDDLFTTNPARVRRGIQDRAGNAVLVKMNQIGTLTETFEVLEIAREAGMRAVVSARSGETEDSFLADLATASGAGQIKVGSVTRSERLAKYNRLLQIGQESGLQFAPVISTH